MTAREQHRAAVFARDPHVCALRPEKTGWPGQDSQAGECWGRLEADHVLKVQALIRQRDRLDMRFTKAPGSLSIGERAFLKLTVEELESDERNGWLLCHRHHHLKDDRLIVITEEIVLPEHFFAFVGLYELAELVKQELRPRPVPAFQNGSGRPGAPRRGL